MSKNDAVCHKPAWPATESGSGVIVKPDVAEDETSTASDLERTADAVPL
jgi:hypothetical protein